MKVVLVHYRLLKFGGLEKRLHNYIEAFQKDGHEVTLLTAYVKPGYTPPKNLRLVILKPGFHLKPFRQWFFGQKVMRWLKQNPCDFSLSLGRTPGADLTLCPGNHLGYLAAHAKKPSSISDFMQIKADKFAFNHTKGILAASPQIKEELELHYQIPSSKIRVLPPPISTKALEKANTHSKSYWRNKLGLDPELLYFLFISTGHANKGLPYLMEWFGQAHKTQQHLLVAGHPPVYPKAQNITGLGYLDDPAPWLKAVDFLIHPSKYEAFGQVIAEALGTQTPVIVSANTGASAYLKPTDGLVLPLNQANAWKQAIQLLKPNQFSISESRIREEGWTLEQHYASLWKFHKEFA